MAVSDEELALALKLKMKMAAASSGSVPPARNESGFRGGAGASGGWGYPDPGLLGAVATKFNQGAVKDGADEMAGAASAMGHEPGPSRYLRLPDGTEVPVPTKADLYRASRDYVRQEQEAADQHWPKLGFMAQMGGEVAGDYALAGANAVKRGYQTLSGLVRGLNMSDAELTPDKATPWDVASAMASTGFGGLVGNQAPVLMSKLGQTGAAKYLGQKADDVFTASGEGLKNLAGWLKVNSIHPTPTLGKKMADLPGGIPGVGRELLDRDIGGLTKGKTAAQVEGAVKKAGSVIDDIAEYHDAAGGAPIDIAPAIARARQEAAKLMSQPTTKEAGMALSSILDEYSQMFSGRNVTAVEALEVKRALGKAVYGAQQELHKSGKTLMGDYGAGLGKFERALDDQLDASLGPSFERANLSYRRLLGAKDATDTQQARSLANMLMLGLGNTSTAVLGALVGGGPGAAAGLAGAAFLSKYGSQIGARGAFNAGRFAQSIPGAARYLVNNNPGGAVGEMSRATGGTLADLLEQIRLLQRPAVPAGAVAGSNE
jgi:hypothetical protein